MDHKTASTKIHFTNDYARFKMINGNRQLNEPRISAIIKEIGGGNDMLRYYPIQVREVKDRLEILDGQHRFYICKKMSLPVFYILIQEDKSMVEIAKVNSNVGKWKGKDFVNCYVQLQNENYIQLQAFIEKYKIGIGVALVMLHYGHPGAEGHYVRLTEAFQSGTFEVKHLKDAEQLAETCQRFDKFKNNNHRGFLIAIYKIIAAGLVGIDDLVAAYKKRPEMLTQQANYKSYVNTLEQMFNVGKQKRIVIC